MLVPLEKPLHTASEALAEGIEQALWQIGGVPKQHRTDHLTAAVTQLPKEQREEWTAR